MTKGLAVVGAIVGALLVHAVAAAEIAYLTVYLASDKAWAITGEVIVAKSLSRLCSHPPVRCA